MGQHCRRSLHGPRKALRHSTQSSKHWNTHVNAKTLNGTHGWMLPTLWTPVMCALLWLQLLIGGRQTGMLQSHQHKGATWIDSYAHMPSWNLACWCWPPNAGECLSREAHRPAPEAEEPAAHCSALWRQLLSARRGPSRSAGWQLLSASPFAATTWRFASWPSPKPAFTARECLGN